MRDNIVPLRPDGETPQLPKEIVMAAALLTDFFAKQGARYWDCGTVCSRLYSMGVAVFAPRLMMKIYRSDDAKPMVQAHNQAVRCLQKMARGEADEEFWNALKELSKA